MKKKLSGKLKINKETLSTLASRDLEEIQGGLSRNCSESCGYTSITCYDSCIRC